MIDGALAHLKRDRPDEAVALLRAGLAIDPAQHEGWLLLGEIHEVEGRPQQALKCWHQAVTRAQRGGLWHNEATTPAHLLPAVIHAIEAVRTGRRDLLFSSYDSVRQAQGSRALKRVDRAVAHYLGELKVQPAHPRQRPKFLYFPDLPADPFLDPMLQPWADRLRDAHASIRDEALRVLAEDLGLEDFVKPPLGTSMRDYVSGEGEKPAWEALFFYRRGQRFDAHHARCPHTSAVLESIDLCRIPEQTPEICFSVLNPGTTILPHHGVSNTRVVMHLPLLVPPGCALNLLDVGEHAWREGELLMFDDTFEHEAWNRSAQHRVLLLMDCWNPHLTPPERDAVTQLIQVVHALGAANEARPPDAP